MEGVAGIVKLEQTTGGEPPYDEGAGSTPRRSTRLFAARVQFYS